MQGTFKFVLSYLTKIMEKLSFDMLQIVNLLAIAQDQVIQQIMLESEFLWLIFHHVSYQAVSWEDSFPPSLFVSCLVKYAAQGKFVSINENS